MPASTRRRTVEEVRAMQDEDRPWPRYGLIDGELSVTPRRGRCISARGRKGTDRAGPADDIARRVMNAYHGRLINHESSS